MKLCYNQKLQAALNEAVLQQKLQPQDSNQLDQLDRSSKLRSKDCMFYSVVMLQFGGAGKIRKTKL